MFKKVITGLCVAAALVLSACSASVPMASDELDVAAKQFTPPAANKAGIYIYRNNGVGAGLKKYLTLDGAAIGQTADKVFIYKEIEPGEHELGTESEFSDNTLSFTAEAGKHYYAEQYIKLGVFVGGANVRMVDEAKGQSQVLKCGLALDMVP